MKNKTFIFLFLLLLGFAFLFISCNKEKENITETVKSKSSTTESSETLDTGTDISTKTIEETENMKTKTSTETVEKTELELYNVNEKYFGKYGFLKDSELILIEIANNYFVLDEEKVYFYINDNNIYINNIYDDKKYNVNFDNDITFSYLDEEITFKKVFFINYNLNGGEYDGVVYFFYDNFPELLSPSKDSSIFIGWYEEDVLIEAINENRDYNLEAKYDTYLPWV